MLLKYVIYYIKHLIFRAILAEIRVFEVARSFRNWRKKTKIAASTKLKAVVALRGIVLTSVILSLTLGYSLANLPLK